MNMYGMCVVDDFLGTTNGLSILKEGKTRTQTQFQFPIGTLFLTMELSLQCTACMQPEFSKMAK